MPNFPIDFQNSVIYKIVPKDKSVKDCYVGSTINFEKRKQSHKNCHNNENSVTYNYPVSKAIREKGGWDNWSMIILEKYPCECRFELETRERYYIEKMKANLNQVIPTRTMKEYYKDNKNIFCKNAKDRYESKKDEILEQHKEYRENHKQEIAETHKEWYEENKERVKKIVEKVEICECGIECQIRNKTRHLKSKKHNAFLNKL